MIHYIAKSIAALLGPDISSKYPYLNNAYQRGLALWSRVLVVGNMEKEKEEEKTLK